MKILYFDCAMGAAGDMLMGALLELCPDKEAFLTELNAALKDLAVVSAAPDVKRGIRGTHISVNIGGHEEGEEHENHHHHHTDAAEIARRLDSLKLSDKVRQDAQAVYKLLLEAESQVHGQPVEHIHLHEVGSVDALADVLGVCMLIDAIKPDQIAASAVHVGSGLTKCAHGLLPVPAPATELILRGVPIYSGNIRGELCTPTGAALLRHFAQSFGPMPEIKVQAVGHGTGKKDFEAANLIRALLGEIEDTPERILELSCNLDDMSAEAVGFAIEELLRLGALDAYTTPIGMKKSRPGVILSCLCRPEQRQEMLKAIFRHTTTLGVREYDCPRYALSRSSRTVETEYGPVRFKAAQGWGITREKAEYEDLARIAREQNLSLRQVQEQLDK